MNAETAAFARLYHQDPPRYGMTFYREAPEFRRDPECEKFLLTFNPGGYLLRW